METKNFVNRNKTFIIAEAGVNHNGSLEQAKQLVDIASECGADAVKFQTFQAEKISSREARKADYQIRTTDESESQYQMLKRLELDHEAHQILKEHCRRNKIQFLSTPFDNESVDLLVYKLKLSLIKIPSGEITNAPLLLKIAQTGSSAILSTGMSTLGEIEMALGVLAFGYTQSGQPSREKFQQAYNSMLGQKTIREKVALMHCTTEYPAPFQDVNLRVIDTLKKAFDLPVGLSDHTSGYAIPIAAVALGAAIIEKHFTLDRNLPGPDHKASLEPAELKNMIQSIRQIEDALGSSIKRPVEVEWQNKQIIRKSIVTACDIKKGEFFTPQNLTTKRPGNGISPIFYWEYLGKQASRDYQPDEMVME